MIAGRLAGILAVLFALTAPLAAEKNKQNVWTQQKQEWKDRKERDKYLAKRERDLRKGVRKQEHEAWKQAAKQEREYRKYLRKGWREEQRWGQERDREYRKQLRNLERGL